jgi:hypothetical protein
MTAHGYKQWGGGSPPLLRFLWARGAFGREGPLGARAGAQNFRGGEVVPKLPVTASRLAPGPDVRTGGRHLPPLPGELHASGNGGSCSTKRGALGHSRQLDRNPHTWGTQG